MEFLESLAAIEYPWGSGGTPEQNHRSFVAMVEEMRAQGLSPKEIADGFGITTTQYRALNSIAKNELRAANISWAHRLRDKGMSNTAIAEKMGLPGESSVRALLQDGVEVRANKLEVLSKELRRQVDEGGYIDVGSGTEHYLGASSTQITTALEVLKNEGYVVTKVQVPQVGTQNKTLIKVLAPPGSTYGEINANQDKIRSMSVNKLEDGTFAAIKPPLQLHLDRVGVNYAENGGTDADGVIFVRPGVPSVSLGGSHYAQVRVGVNGTHYLKGMAVYKNDLPEGVDVVFNTNKHDTGNKLDALKPVKDDPTDPFGAVIKRQILNDKQQPSSAMNIVNEEGDWNKWSKNLASQVLSKQKPILAKEQLDKTFAEKRKDLDEIEALTNPAVKRKLLDSYADGVDSASVHLKAAAMPRQRTQVILPVKDIKQNEVYAPNFKDGERVALVRYPHGGTFEIPELIVNNRNPAGIELLGKAAKDAIGIHPKTAEQLSGADFDGDTVLVIPNNSGKIKSKAPLAALKNFDPKVTYAPYDGMATIDGGRYNAVTKKVEYGPKGPTSRKQTEMGKVSNLITDMTIKGAPDTEIARAVKHSMVVIDAEKHVLNFKQSAIDNGITQLKEKYQGGRTNGSTTIISRTTSDARVPERKATYKIDPTTGEKKYFETGATYVDKQGRVVEKKTKISWGEKVKDAHELTSAYDSKGNRVGTAIPIEKVYADHSNKLRSLANEARLDYVNTKSIPYSPSAKKVYAKEVSDLNNDLKIALRNAPKERQAQLLANAIVKQKTLADPNLDAADLKKINGKALTEARIRTGAKKNLVPITDRQWEAIQAGAISNHMLEKILNNTDLDRVKELATPRQNTVMTSIKQQRAKQLLSAGRTMSEVAEILGVPLSTLTSSIE